MVNILIAVVGSLLSLWVVSIALSSYTHHGETIVVPDLTNVPLEESAGLLENEKLGFLVIDSAVFNDLYAPLSVIEQYPEPNAEVKEGRVIHLTINPKKPRKIELPNVVEKTLRRAIHELESRNLVVGQLIYVPDLGRDVVIGLQVNNEEVQPGDKFDKGTTIDLVVGKGLSDVKINVPYLKFLSLEEALSKLKEASLNKGVVFYDEEITDSSAAIVYRQSPRASKTPYIRMGSSIDLWLTNDHNKVENDSLEFKPQVAPDSLNIETTE